MLLLKVLLTGLHLLLMLPDGMHLLPIPLDGMLLLPTPAAGTPLLEMPPRRVEMPRMRLAASVARKRRRRTTRSPSRSTSRRSLPSSLSFFPNLRPGALLTPTSRTPRSTSERMQITSQARFVTGVLFRSSEKLGTDQLTNTSCISFYRRCR